MQNNDKGRRLLGESKIPAKPVQIQEQFWMDIPESFVQEPGLAARYSYYSDQEDSLCGIAVRFAQVSDVQAREKMMRTYFGGEGAPEQVLLPNQSEAFFREGVSEGSETSVYLFRFAVPEPGGMFLGCFSCNGKEKETWRSAVLDMVCAIRRTEELER